MRLEDDRPIATSSAALRTVARVVLEQGECRGLLGFGTADDHLHALLAAVTRATAGCFARYVESALRQGLRLGAGFQRARFIPVRDQRHAYNALNYVHRQDSRHDLHRDVMRDGTSLPELLGLRVIDTSLIARVRAHLPRVRREDLVEHFPAGVFDDADSEGPIEHQVLADAAAAAFALPDLAGRSFEVARARRAAIHVAGPDMPTRSLVGCLGIKARAVQTLRLAPVEPRVVRAVKLQTLLRMRTAKLLDVA